MVLPIPSSYYHLVQVRHYRSTYLPIYALNLRSTMLDIFATLTTPVQCRSYLSGRSCLVMISSSHRLSDTNSNFLCMWSFLRLYHIPMLHLLLSSCNVFHCFSFVSYTYASHLFFLFSHAFLFFCLFLLSFIHYLRRIQASFNCPPRLSRAFQCMILPACLRFSNQGISSFLLS